MQVHWTIKETL